MRSVGQERVAACRTGLVGAFAAGRQCRCQGAGAGLDDGVYATLEDLARARGLNATFVSRMLRLTLLAPEIVEAILDGRQPVGLQLDNLLEPFPLEWEKQRLLTIERQRRTTSPLRTVAPRPPSPAR
jgi:hypothetical protein